MLFFSRALFSVSVASYAQSVACLPQPPAWPDVVTAIATTVLVLGVLWAARQFHLTRKIAQVTETRNLINELTKAVFFKTLEEKLDVHPRQEDNVAATKVLLEKDKDYLKEELLDFNDFAERMEIYIRKGFADFSIIAEHVGYNIILTYLCLEPVIQRLAKEDDYNVDCFRDLVLRIQDHGKFHPLDTDLRADLLFAKVPVLQYAGGDSSLGFHRSLLHRLGVSVLNGPSTYNAWVWWCKAWDWLNPL